MKDDRLLSVISCGIIRQASRHGRFNYFRGTGVSDALPQGTPVAPSMLW